MPARSTTPGLGAVACTPYGGALPSDHVSSMTLTETQMRLPCGQWNSFATSTSLTSLTEDGAAGRERDDFWSSRHPLSLAPLDPRIRNDLGPSFDLKERMRLSWRSGGNACATNPISRNFPFTSSCDRISVVAWRTTSRAASGARAGA